MEERIPIAIPACPHHRSPSLCPQCHCSRSMRIPSIDNSMNVPPGVLSQWPRSFRATTDHVPESWTQSFHTAGSTHPQGWWLSSSVKSGYDLNYQALSPSLRHQHMTTDSAQFSRSPMAKLDAISNDYNYHEVPSDRTCQKRSVSLSTIPLPTVLLRQQQLPDTNTEATPLLSGRCVNRTAELYDSSDSEDDEDDEKAGLWRRWLKQLASFQLSHKQKLVLKCSLAYAIGCLFTFVPALNECIGGSTVSSHVISIVTVFFNPAKSIGGMIEALGYGVLYGLALLALCILNMTTANYLIIEHNQYIVSCLVTLMVWVGSSTFIISFLKARLNLLNINAASSLSFIILSTILVREGSTNNKEYEMTKIKSTFTIVLIGATITTAVCLCVWPMRSTKQLKRDIDATLMSIRVLKKLLTETFLLDADFTEFTANKQLENAIKSHSASFSALEASLKEAKREFFSLDMWRHADGYDKTVACLQRLAQHICGLRSSCGLHFEENPVGVDSPKRWHPANDSPSRFSDKRSETWNIRAGHHRKKMEHELRLEHSLEQQGMFYMDEDISNTTMSQIDRQASSTKISRHPSDLNTVRESHLEDDPSAGGAVEEGALNQFIRCIRGPMKALSYTCKQTIIHIQARFTGQVNSDTPSLMLLKHNLTTAIDTFEETERSALLRFYRRKIQATRDRRYSWPNVSAGDLHSHLGKQFPAEDVFLVYSFVFCMLEFANELVSLVEHVENLFEEDADAVTVGGHQNHSWSYSWSQGIAWLHSIYDRLWHASDTATHEQDKFVPNNNNTFNTLHTPTPTTHRHRLYLKVWSILSWFRQHTVRYAFKASVTAVAIASLAYIPATQHYFLDLRMEWTLVAAMAVMSPTVGGTNIVAILRVLASMLGCIVATLVCVLFAGNASLLWLLSWGFSVPCFWIILHHRHSQFGQFALLAYDLVVLYSYNRNQNTPVDVVFELAWKRCVAVSFGVMVGLIVTAYIWPFEARKELRKGLSDFLLRLSWLYKQLVSVYSDAGQDMGNNDYSTLIEQLFYDIHPTSPRKPTPQELEIMAQRNAALSAELQLVELDLQLSLVQLRGLLVHAPNEPRLKGAFPVGTYDAMLTCCQNILDKFLSIRIVVLKETWAVQVRHVFVRPASREWMDMAGNILLYFYLLASALQLKTPLPPYLPPAEKAREMLMAKLQQILTNPAAFHGVANTTHDDNCHMVYYAYVVMMEGIIRELDKLGYLMRELYGSLVPADQWMRCFGLVEQHPFHRTSRHN